MVNPKHCLSKVEKNIGRLSKSNKFFLTIACLLGWYTPDSIIEPPVTTQSDTSMFEERKAVLNRLMEHISTVHADTEFRQHG